MCRSQADRVLDRPVRNPVAVAAVEILRTVPLFEGMTDRSVEAVAGLARAATFPAGEVLTREGDPGDRFIVLTAGTAKVTQGERRLRTLGPGDFFGEISLIDGGPRTATVTATAPLEALVIERDGFERVMADFPTLRLDLVSALTQRLRERAPADGD
jgi:CRP/FNR family cyclic AMP-dependent transcriptional regulator